MTRQSLQHRHEARGGHHSSAVDSVAWAPQIPSPHVRRSPWEQALIVEVSLNGAVVHARTNSNIVPGTRVSIGLGNTRGLVAVRRVTPSAEAGMSDYGVQFLWLDPKLQTFFDESCSTDVPVDFETRGVHVVNGW